MWEGSALPLRTEKANAAHTVTLGSSFVNVENRGTGDLPTRMKRAAVFQKGDRVTLHLSGGVQGAGTGQFSGEKAQLVVARFAPSGARNVSTIPSTLGGVHSLLTGSNVDQNATFSLVNGTTVNSTGSLTVQSPPLNRAGVYGFFLATSPNGTAFSAPGGNLRVDGNATVIGAEDAVVQTASSDVTGPKTVHPGKNASFHIRTPAGAESLNHTVLVYNKRAFVNSTTKFDINGKITRHPRASNVTIRTDTPYANGVARFNGPVTVLGHTFGNYSKTGDYSAQQVYDAATAGLENRTGLNASGANIVRIGNRTLDASMVGVSNANRNTTLDVPTLANWSTGTYVWVALSGNPNGFYTDKGTFQVKTPSKTKSGGHGGRSTNPPSGGSGGSTRTGGSGPSHSHPTVTRTPGTHSTNVSIHGAQRNQTVDVDLPNASDDLNASGVALNHLSVRFARNSNGFDLNVTTRNASSVHTPSANGSTPIGYFQIDHSQSDSQLSSVTFTFSVSTAHLQRVGLNRNQVALYRNNGGGWRTLQTTFVNESNGVISYRAVSPGFSTYEIGSSPPAFQVSNPQSSTTSTTAGSAMSFSANVTNTGGTKGTKTVPLTIDGKQADSKTLTLGPGESRTVTFSHTFQSSGTYTLSIDGTSLGSIHVPPSSTGGTTTQGTTTQGTTNANRGSPSSPGGTGGGGFPTVPVIIILIVVVVVGALYVYRGR